MWAMLVSDMLIGAGYNSKKAVDYVHKFTIDNPWNCNKWIYGNEKRTKGWCPEKWNSDYTKDFSTPSNTDCIHFISQALHIAGIPMDEEGALENEWWSSKLWYNNGGNVISGKAENISSTWRGVTNFKARIDNDEFKNYKFEEINPRNAISGDLILLKGSTKWYHAMLATGSANTEKNFIPFTAHTNDRYDYPYYYETSYRNGKLIVYRITPKSPSETKLPKPKITSVVYPSHAMVGDEVEISIEIKNTGASTDKGYISVSFPGIRENQITSKNESTKVYPSGSRIYNKSEGRAIDSNYLLVEYASGEWRNETTKTLTFKIRLDENGQQEFYVRSSLHVKGKPATSAVDTPLNGDYIDQQGYEVNAYTIVISDNHGQEKDGYENDNSKSRATTLRPNNSQTHNIYPASDEDWYTFTIDKRSDIKIQTENEIGTIEVTLFDSNMYEIDTDYTRVSKDKLPKGVYYVQINEHNYGGTDDYSIVLTVKNSDYNDMPVPYIYTPSYPNEVKLNKYASLSIKVKNKGYSANSGYITVSFPSLTSRSDKDFVYVDDSSVRVYSKGDNIYNKTTKSNMKAKYLMIEYLDSNWNANEINQLNFKIQAEKKENIYFYVRSSMSSKEGGYVDNPTTTSYTDQQGYAVNRYKINVQYNTVPNNNDSDGDGISNSKEIELGLNPNNVDSDGDGIPDLEEVGNIDAPLDSDNDGKIDALDEDSDNDGVSDKVEREQATNPRDPNDKPIVPRVYLQPIDDIVMNVNAPRRAIDLVIINTTDEAINISTTSNNTDLVVTSNTDPIYIEPVYGAKGHTTIKVRVSAGGKSDTEEFTAYVEEKPDKIDYRWLPAVYHIIFD